MSYKIEKYADKNQFIVEYNHRQGLLIQDGAELVDGLYVEFTYALLPNEMMFSEQVEIDVNEYAEDGEVIGTHKETVTLNYPIINPNYEAEQAEKEKERIGKLECTKRVFVLMLEQLGIGYFDKIEPLIKSNPQAQLEWELCVKLERSNPLLDIMAGQLGVTSEQLDGLFKYANGEITLEEFKGFTPVEASESNTGVEADGE